MAKKEVNFMGLKEKKVKSIGGLIVQCIWLIPSLIIFFSGLSMFKEDKTFLSWVIWGVVCCIPMLFDIIKSTVIEAKKGWAEGSREYSVTVSSSSVTVQNHPLEGAITSILVSLFMSALAGPIFLPVSMLSSVHAILVFVRELIKAKKINK